MKEPFLDNFNLVGGTALGLLIGHRISVDIDLFTAQPFDASWIASALTPRYNDVEDLRITGSVSKNLDLNAKRQDLKKV